MNERHFSRRVVLIRGGAEQVYPLSIVTLSKPDSEGLCRLIGIEPYRGEVEATLYHDSELRLTLVERELWRIE